MAKKYFDIKSNQPISKLFLERQITTFENACEYVKNIPYGRNKNKDDLTTIFIDNCGTCSTKHALLKQLAIENNFETIKLILGVFKMNKYNTPEVMHTLNKYDLQYIPEAHNYLNIDGEIIDCTKQNYSQENFINDLLTEIEISPNQITDFKINYHKAILKNWLLDNPNITINFHELWTIREKCIMDLSLGVK